MKTYCYDCGAKLEFSPRDKPKFCAKCGVSLDGKKKVRAARACSTQKDLPTPADEEEDVTHIPNIDGLDFDFLQGATTNNKMTIGSIMGTLDPDQIQKGSSRGPKITPEQAMEQFKREAGSIRQNQKKKDAQT